MRCPLRMPTNVPSVVGTHIGHEMSISAPCDGDFLVPLRAWPTPAFRPSAVKYAGEPATGFVSKKWTRTKATRSSARNPPECHSRPTVAESDSLTSKFDLALDSTRRPQRTQSRSGIRRRLTLRVQILFA